MEAKLQQQAMRSAIDSTKTSIRASHAQERKQFRESRRPAASAGKLGRGGRRPSLASARSVESSGVEAVQAPLRLATDPATAGCAQPVVTARVLKVADEALAAARRRPGHSRRTGSAGDSVDGDDIDDEAGHSRRGSGPSAGCGVMAPARSANTEASSRELDASRLAPWTPVNATSPDAKSPSTSVRPSRSTTTPPHM